MRPGEMGGAGGTQSLQDAVGAKQLVSISIPLLGGKGGLAHVGRHMRKINDAIGQAD